MSELPELGAVIRELVTRKGLHEFVRQFWTVIEPAAPFTDGWVLGAITEHLQAVSARQIRKLVINVPPGTGKSSLVCVAWPTWHWTFDPSHRWMFASHDYDLVLRDANRSIRLMQDPTFRQAWPEFNMGRHVKAAGQFENGHGGRRFGTSIEGGGVGWHADTQVCDDPNKPKDAQNREALAKSVNWWSGTMALRRADPATFARLIIMQRIADDDLAGVCLKEQGYEHLCLPMRYEPSCSWDMGSSLGKIDPREEPGELLWPERFSEETLAELAKELRTPENVSAQLQQNPTPSTGGILEAHWLEHVWEALPRGINLFQSWDLGFKGSKSAHSRVVGMLWGEFDQDFLAIDATFGTWNYPETKRQFALAQSLPMWPDALAILIEEKANGSALIAELEEGYECTLPGATEPTIVQCQTIERVNPKDDKLVRLISHTDRFRAGRVKLPKSAPWLAEYRAEMLSFPRGQKDDFVDVTTQALDRMADKYARYLEALKGIQR